MSIFSLYSSVHDGTASVSLIFVIFVLPGCLVSLGARYVFATLICQLCSGLPILLRYVDLPFLAPSVPSSSSFAPDRDMRYAVCDMRYAICGVWYAVCDVRYAGKTKEQEYKWYALTLDLETLRTKLLPVLWLRLGLLSKYFINYRPYISGTYYLLSTATFLKRLPHKLLWRNLSFARALGVLST